MQKAVSGMFISGREETKGRIHNEMQHSLRREKEEEARELTKEEELKSEFSTNILRL